MEKHLRHLPKLDKGETCLNCGHKLQGDDNFCSRCGQLNNTKRQTFMDWVREVLGDFFAYDSRLLNSLTPLLLKPGQLSIDYINGKRSSHIHPMRLYLVVSFIMFLLISITDFKEKYTLTEDSNTEITNVSFNGSKNSSIYSIFDKDIIDDSLIDISRKNYRDRFMLYLLDIKKYDNLDYEKARERYDFKKTSLDKFTFNKAVEYSTFTFDKLGDLLIDKLPVIAFLFLPFFVIFLNLIHYKKDILYLEHLVFAFHTQSALFILMIIGEIFTLIYQPLGDFIVNSFSLVIFPIYLFIALKKYYKYKTYKKTIVMFLTINTIYLTSAFLAFVLGIFFTFFSY